MLQKLYVVVVPMATRMVTSNTLCIIRYSLATILAYAVLELCRPTVCFIIFLVCVVVFILPFPSILSGRQHSLLCRCHVIAICLSGRHTCTGAASKRGEIGSRNPHCQLRKRSSSKRCPKWSLGGQCVLTQIKKISKKSKFGLQTGTIEFSTLKLSWKFTLHAAVTQKIF